MILRNPYDFRSLRLTRMEDTVKAINRYIVADYAYSQGTDPFKIRLFRSNNAGDYINAIILYGKSEMEKDIPVFGHPYFSEQNKWIALDLRQCTKIDKESGKIEIRNQTEYNLSINRFILSGLWCADKTNSMFANHFPMTVYGDWLSTNLTRVFGLGLADQQYLYILSCFYYASLFGAFADKEEIEKVKLKIRKTVYSDDIIDEVLSKIDKLESIDDYCRLTYVVTNNIRLKGLDFVSLTNVINNNWFGLNARELTLLALDHPPTWISLVLSAVVDRGYRNTLVAKLADQRGKRGVGADFVKDIQTLIKEQIEG